MVAWWDRKADLQILRCYVTHDVERGRDDSVIFVPVTDDDTRTDRLRGITPVDRDDARPHAGYRLLGVLVPSTPDAVVQRYEIVLVEIA